MSSSIKYVNYSKYLQEDNCLIQIETIENIDLSQGGSNSNLFQQLDKAQLQKKYKEFNGKSFEIKSKIFENRKWICSFSTNIFIAIAVQDNQINIAQKIIQQIKQKIMPFESQIQSKTIQDIKDMIQIFRVRQILNQICQKINNEAKPNSNFQYRLGTKMISVSQQSIKMINQKVKKRKLIQRQNNERIQRQLQQRIQSKDNKVCILITSAILATVTLIILILIQKKQIY